MSYKIVVDSCCDLPREYHNDPRFEIVPLVLQIGDYHTLDDESFDQADFLKRIAESETCAKTACPSPDRYMKAYTTDADDVYVVTLSSKLSGSYNSALLAKDIYHEEKGEKNIHVFDSLSACCGEAQIAFKIIELADKGKKFEEIIEEVEKFRDGMNTYFVLDNLETLRKNGRLSGMKAVVASTLNIKPICIAVKGEIAQKGQGIGTKKTMLKLADMVSNDVENPEERKLCITHINCYERAEIVRNLILKKTSFASSLLVDGAGVSTTYANDGGIVITF